MTDDDLRLLEAYDMGFRRGLVASRAKPNNELASEPEIYARSAISLGLGGHAPKVLERMGIKTVGQLVKTYAIDLLDQKNCGDRTVEDIRGALAAIGLALAGEQNELEE